MVTIAIVIVCDYADNKDPANKNLVNTRNGNNM